MAGKKNKTNKYWNFRLKLGTVLLCIFLIIGFIMPVFCKVSPVEWQSYSRNMNPTAEHWLGTTGLGQDVFWLLAYSVRNSFLVGMGVAFFATAIGVFMGLLAGFIGGLGRQDHHASDRFLYCDPIPSHIDPHIEYAQGDCPAFFMWRWFW